MRTVFLVFLLLVALAVAAVCLAALRARRNRTRANRVVPGVPTRAPRAWAGAHTREARLHRRLRDLVASAQQAAEASPAVAGAGADIAQLALHLDDQLITAAALPANARDGAVEKVASSVEKLEQAVVRLAEATSGDETDAAIDELTRWLSHLSEARTELEQP